MNNLVFADPDTWIGGFYELSIEFYPVGNNDRLNLALLALQNLECFNGYWQVRHDYQSDPISLPITINHDSVSKLYGTLKLSDGNILPCLVSVIRIEGESDWLDVSIPQAALEQLYPYEYPLTNQFNPWLEKVDSILIKAAETIYNQSPFDLAMIGEEISGYTSQGEITLEDIEKVKCILPIDLQNRLMVQEKGLLLAKQLRLTR